MSNKGTCGTMIKLIIKNKIIINIEHRISFRHRCKKTIKYPRFKTVGLRTSLTPPNPEVRNFKIKH